MLALNAVHKTTRVGPASKTMILAIKEKSIDLVQNALIDLGAFGGIVVEKGGMVVPSAWKRRKYASEVFSG